ncbi:MAG: ABC transporter substrate-binding protein [Spirochaetia bacterium]
MKIQKLGKLTSTFTFTFIAALLFVACTAKTPDETGSETNIKIGVITYEKEGNIERVSTLNSATLAAEKFNGVESLEIGGVRKQVTLIVKGIKGHAPESSVKAVRELVNQDNVVAILGPQSSIDAIPAGEVAEQSRIPLIAPISTNPKTTAGRDYVFRMGFLDDFQGHVAAYFSREELGAESAAVVYNVANPYSRLIAEEFRKHFKEDGGRVEAFESYTTDEDDFSRQLEMVRSRDPDVLFLPNYSTETELIVHQARKMGIGSVFMGGDSWDRHEFAKNLEFDGSYMTAHYSADIRTSENESFVKEYLDRYGLLPGDTAALTYDAFNMIFNAIKHQGNADPESIRDGLYSMGPFEGVGGGIDFTDTGDPEKGAVILKFTEGKVRFIGIVNPN